MNMKKALVGTLFLLLVHTSHAQFQPHWSLSKNLNNFDITLLYGTNSFDVDEFEMEGSWYNRDHFTFKSNKIFGGPETLVVEFGNIDASQIEYGSAEGFRRSYGTIILRSRDNFVTSEKGEFSRLEIRLEDAGQTDLENMGEDIVRMWALRNFSQFIDGTWKDENSTVTYKQNGTWSGKWTSGSTSAGTWEFSDNEDWSYPLFIFTHRSGTTFEYDIVDMTLETMIWVGIKNGDRWEAKKLTDGAR